MPRADWQKCAACVALPTTHTSASQPETGNGSPEASYSTSPTSCRSWSRSSCARRSSSLRVCSRLMPGSSSGRRCHLHHTPAGVTAQRALQQVDRLATRRSPRALKLIGLHSRRRSRRTGGMTDDPGLDALDVALLTALEDHPRAGDLELSRVT